MNGQYTPDYATNMLPEVTLEAEKKQKKAFGDTYVGGLATDLVQWWISSNQPQVGKPVQSQPTPINALQPLPSITITAPPAKKDNSLLIIGGSVLGAGIVGFGIYALIKSSNSKKVKKPLNGVRGSKKKRTPKNHEIINL